MSPEQTARAFALRDVLWRVEDMAAEARRAEQDAREHGADTAYPQARVATLGRVADGLRKAMEKERVDVAD